MTLAFAQAFDVPVAEFWRPPSPSDELGVVVVATEASPPSTGWTTRV